VLVQVISTQYTPVFILHAYKIYTGRIFLEINEDKQFLREQSRENLREKIKLFFLSYYFIHNVIYTMLQFIIIH